MIQITVKMDHPDNTTQSGDVLPRLVKTPWFFKQFLLAKDPLAFVAEVAKLGDFVQVRGLVNFYLVNHPDLVKLVIKTKSRNVDRDSIVHNRIKNVSRTGLITSGGEYWKQQRRTMAPVFTPKNVKSLVSKMSDIVQQRFEVWDRYSETGTAFDVSDEMDRLTLEINCSSQFSTSLKEDFDDLQESFDFINRYIAKIPYPVVTKPWFPSPSNLKLKRVIKKLDVYIGKLIDEREKDIGKYNDFITLLLTAKDEETGKGMSREAIIHEVLVFFIAGYETTSKVMTWAWYHMHSYPDIAKKLRQEVDEVVGKRVPNIDDVENLRYTRMFIEETLRVKPSAWFNGKATIEEDEISGARIPPKSLMVTVVPELQRHPRYWTDPDRFDPERFNEERSKGITKYSYIPFGAGPHVCIGQHFAMWEMIIAMAALISRYEIVVEPSFVPEAIASLSLAPKYPMMAKAYRRQ